MERLIKTGKLTPKNSLQIKKSRIGIGFEKLDRDAFDPNKAYDKVFDIGIKWARIQSGWQKTERIKGVYDFVWLDEIVDNFLRRGIIPWISLSYGNDLYTESAKEVYGAVGCPPIFSVEEKQAWARYVEALVKKYKGKVTHYEVWNEPDGIWCWKHGVSGTEIGNFTIDTAKAIRRADTDCEIIGGAICFNYIAFLTEAFETGMGDWIDAISFHKYSSDDYFSLQTVKALRGVVDKYNPKIKLIQGETGSQSRSDGQGALRHHAWTPRKQAKQLLRHTMLDLMSEVEFCSYFSCMDMKEALNGIVGNSASYKDFGYFGVLSAQFDENGDSIGEYEPKDSYYALQNICTLFSDGCEVANLPVWIKSEYSPRISQSDIKYSELLSGGFKLDNGKNAFVYWKPENLLTTDFEGTVTLEIICDEGKIELVDLYDGLVYTLSDSLIEKTGKNTVKLKHIPIKDYPLVLIF